MVTGSLSLQTHGVESGLKGAESWEGAERGSLGKDASAVAKERIEQAVCFVDPTAAPSCQPLSQFWTCLGLVSLQFVLGMAVPLRQQIAILSLISFFFLLVSETSVTRNAAPLYALVGEERIIRKTALLLEISALSVHL